ncbi:protein phosphatase 2C domain-containing protein [Fontivita pretiosa]|uniref:protein phosphatase 2C domain-containing protein n=1 Tax=Fontivita pretiosa TaxID=2989684 RepID=UPI003D17D07C
MQVFAHPFWTPKRGNEDSEYEDAFWPRKSIEHSAPCFRCAVADGATETSYSGIWAKQLVRYMCKNCPSTVFDPDGFRDLQQRWSTIVRKRPLPWYAEEKIRLGAFAAILGMTLYQGVGQNGGTWKAVAIGDSCLVQVRGEEVLARFPLADSGAFSSRPHLLSSNPAHNSHIVAHLRTIDGTWQPGDAFYLMTDALASWFMRELEEGHTPWRILRDFDTKDEVKPFREWVESLRAQRAVRNDDVTLLRVDLA